MTDTRNDDKKLENGNFNKSSGKTTHGLNVGPGKFSFRSMFVPAGSPAGNLNYVIPFECTFSLYDRYSVYSMYKKK